MPHSVRRNELANAAIKLWRGDSESLQYLGDSANYVYSFVHSGKTRYLRLTSSYDRTKEQIEAELDFIAYLHRSGVGAALPISSVARRLFEDIPLQMLFCLPASLRKRKVSVLDMIPPNLTKNTLDFVAERLDKFTLSQKITFLPIAFVDSLGMRISC